MVKIMMNILFLLLLSTIIVAHGNEVNPIIGFMYGFKHPILGLDHLLAMLCVGMISSRIGKKAIWQVPSCFVIVMAVGCVIGYINHSIPLFEFIIALSVIVFGLLFLFPRFLSLRFTLLVVAIFAVVHGMAHGREMPAAISPIIYTLGFLTSTTIIHVVGVLLGEISLRIPRSVLVVRMTGLVLVFAGLSILIV